MGFIIAIIIFISAIAIGYLYGKSIELKGSLNFFKEKRKAYILLSIGILLLSLIIAYWINIQKSIEISRKEASQKQTYFDRLVVDNHIIKSINHTLSNDKNILHIDIITNGDRGGEYSLKIEIVEDLYNKAIYSKKETIFLQKGSNDNTILIDYKELITSYNEKIFNKQQINFGVQGNFIVTAILEPILNEEEFHQTDKNEIQNLKLGSSKLISKKRDTIPFDFHVTGNNYEIK